jgi:two-component system, chemotaxis family, chemotaxis protein CheY
MMPEMDGRAALREIRALETAQGIVNNGVKVIMTTALGDTKTLFGSFNETCDGYVVKPIETEKLLGYVRSFGLIANGPVASPEDSFAVK